MNIKELFPNYIESFRVVKKKDGYYPIVDDDRIKTDKGWVKASKYKKIITIQANNMYFTPNGIQAIYSQYGEDVAYFMLNREYPVFHHDKKSKGIFMSLIHFGELFEKMYDKIEIVNNKIKSIIDSVDKSVLDCAFYYKNKNELLINFDYYFYFIFTGPMLNPLRDEWLMNGLFKLRYISSKSVEGKISFDVQGKLSHEAHDLRRKEFPESMSIKEKMIDILGANCAELYEEVLVLIKDSKS